MGIAGFFLWLQRWYGNCIDNVPQAVVDAALKGEALPLGNLSTSKDGGGGGGGGGPRSGVNLRYDNFYVDMNGLIHPCCHDTQPLPEPETEEEMFERMFEQLDLMVKVVRPRKCLVLCIDGVAPRSKMNQQRSRRFRAADERLESDAISTACADRIEKEYGLPRPRVRERWDSNVITPSTAFMERVGLALEWFIMKKLNEDPAWKHLVVVFSDAHVPGEGEHKIMHYIRGLRAQPGYDHRTSHVIHGMDADLVCLGLSTHEEYVSILRNQLTETFQPDHNRFCFFNLHTYRECLKKDFANLAEMDFERVVDDFIFLCFFVGNDFLPHVPLISIKTKGIEMLLDHYVRDFKEHSYLTKGGEVNYKRLHLFLQGVVTKGMKSLQREYHGVLRARERAKQHVEERVTTTMSQVDTLLEEAKEEPSRAQEVSDKLLSLLTTVAKERTRLVAGKEALGFSYLDAEYRDQYYQRKFEWDPTDRVKFEANVQLCCAEYLRGMQWVMRYYTKGCPSWEWYYPFHYAPLLQDLAAFKNEVDVDMRISAPLHPVEQLLAVLPRLSVNALPEELHEAVNDPTSVLSRFYPDKVDVDFSEANFSYQGVLRIPFINCRALHDACKELVELEEDVGTTFLYCHESNPVSRQLDRLVQSGPTPAAAATAPAEPLPAATGTTQAVAAAGLSYTMVPLTAEVAALSPIAVRIGSYEGEWPRHAKLECPDPGIASDTTYGGPITNNAVHGYRYELNTHADYKQRLLGEKRRARVRSPSPDEASHKKRTASKSKSAHSKTSKTTKKARKDSRHSHDVKKTKKSSHDQHRHHRKEEREDGGRHDSSAASSGTKHPSELRHSRKSAKKASTTETKERHRSSKGEKHGDKQKQQQKKKQKKAKHPSSSSSQPKNAKKKKTTVKLTSSSVTVTVSKRRGH